MLPSMSFRRRLFSLVALFFNFGDSAILREDDFIPGKYIVQLKSGIDPIAIQAHHAAVQSIHERHAKRQVGGIVKTYHIGDFSAYVGSFDDATAAELELLPEVRRPILGAKDDACFLCA